MQMVFVELLNRSIAAGWLILIVLLLRALKLRFPRWFYCLLWGIVGVRLALPFEIESALSLIPSTQTIAPSFELGRMTLESGMETLDAQLNHILDARFKTASIAPMVWYIETAKVCSVFWFLGALGLALYGVISEWRLCCRLRVSLRCDKNVYLCDEIDSPFVLGALRPRIYLPSSMEEAQRKNVLLHERAHIARLDPLWKVLGYVILCVYWFNPLVWVAYIALGRDLEFACDERVLGKMCGEDKREYAQCLLSCSIRRKAVAMSPVGFGDVGVKRRIQCIVWFKNASDRAVLWAIILCLVLALGFLTNPISDADESPAYTQRFGTMVFYSMCACEGSTYVSGEYFYPQNSDIYTACDVCDYATFHVHESGVVQQVGYCSECGQIMCAQPLYEGYQCLRTDGAFVKTDSE